MLFTQEHGRAFDFTGRLSFSWPATALPVTFDEHGAAQGALFPRGYGLTSAESKELGFLSEDPQLPPSAREQDTLFQAGHVTAPWSIYVSDSAGEVRLTMQLQASPTGAVTAALISRSVQVTWSGIARGEFRIGERPVNIDHQALRLHYRVEEKPKQPVILGTRCEGLQRCGMGRTTGLDLGSYFRTAHPGKWETLIVSLTCLEDAGAALSEVTAPLALETTGHFSVAFDDIRLVTEIAPSCPPNM
jgi:beta-glucosidase